MKKRTPTREPHYRRSLNHKGKVKSARCDGKIRYKTRDDAMIALAYCKSSHSKNRNEKRVYYCNVCHGWHLTSKITAAYNTATLRVLAPEAVTVAQKVARVNRWDAVNMNRFISSGLHALDGSGLPIAEWNNIWVWRKLRTIVENMLDNGEIEKSTSLPASVMTAKFNEFTEIAGEAYRKTKGISLWGTVEQTIALTNCYSEEQSAWFNVAPGWLCVASEVFDETQSSTPDTGDNE